MDNVQGGGVLVKNPVSAPGPPPLSKILDPRLLYSKFGMKSQMAASRHLGFPGHRLLESKK